MPVRTSRIDLWSCVRNGEAEVLLDLLRSGVHVDELDDHGVSALMLAASRGDVPLVDLLLSHGACLSLADRESGYSALHRALLHCHFAAASRLLLARASLDAPLDREGLSPLALACRAARPPRAAAGGFVVSWGAAGSVAIGRTAGAAAHAVAAGRVELGDRVAARALACSKLHTLIADAAGGLHSFGLGIGGRLGHGDQMPAVLPRALRLPRVRVREVAAGPDHSLAITECGELFSWGAATAPLGYETAATDQLLPRRVKLPTERSTKVLHAATSARHCVACTRDARGAVACYGWGANEQMQLALRGADGWVTTPCRVERLSVLGASPSLACGGAHSAGVAEDGSVYCWGYDCMAPKKLKLPLPSLGEGLQTIHHRGKPLAKSVTCGISHTVAVSDRGHVYAWAAEMSPQLIQLPPGSYVVHASAASYSTVAVTSSGLVYSWKEHWHAGKPPHVHWHSEVRQAVHAAASDQHTAVIIAEHQPPFLSLCPAAEAAGDEAGEEDGGVAGLTSVPRLMTLCEVALQPSVSTRNCLQLWYTADAIGAALLGAYCCAYCAANLELVLRGDLWAHVPPHLLEQLGHSLRPTPLVKTLSEGIAEDEWEEQVASAAHAEAMAVDWREYYFEGPRQLAVSEQLTPAEPTARLKKLRKKLKQAEALEARLLCGDGDLTRDEHAKAAARQSLEDELLALTIAHPQLASALPLSPAALPSAAPPAPGIELHPRDEEDIPPRGSCGVSLLQRGARAGNGGETIISQARTRRTKWRSLGAAAAGGEATASAPPATRANIAGWEYVAVGEAVRGWGAAPVPRAPPLSQILSEQAHRQPVAEASVKRGQSPASATAASDASAGAVSLMHFVRRPTAKQAKQAKEESPAPAWGSPSASPTIAPSATMAAIQREQREEVERRQEQRTLCLAASPAAGPRRCSLSSDWSLSPTQASPQSSWGMLPEPSVISLEQIQTEEFLREELERSIVRGGAVGREGNSTMRDAVGEKKSGGRRRVKGGQSGKEVGEPRESSSNRQGLRDSRLAGESSQCARVGEGVRPFAAHKTGSNVSRKQSSIAPHETPEGKIACEGVRCESAILHHEETGPSGATGVSRRRKTKCNKSPAATAVVH
ncbi:hypothetical protein AB1Y20_015728 [Prymnesium parvum]|uniref:Inhibitor of Bruton tyrosine kinase n=1 Tax=Prymnesium parvum TaxID=97485 RepID=A0AB34K1S6_PRYPA